MVEKYNRILMDYNEWLAEQQYIMQYLQRVEGIFRKAK